MNAEQIIRRVADELELPKEIADEALAICADLPFNIRVGRNNNDVAAACLLYVIKNNCIAVPASKVFKAIYGEDIFVSERPMWRLYRKIAELLGGGLKLCQVTPTIFVQRILEKLHADHSLKRKAAEINRAVIDKRLHIGKPPPAVAAAIVYISSVLTKAGLGQGRVAEVAGVSIITVRNNVKTIKRGLGIAFDKDEKIREMHRQKKLAMDKLIEWAPDVLKGKDRLSVRELERLFVKKAQECGLDRVKSLPAFDIAKTLEQKRFIVVGRDADGWITSGSPITVRPTIVNRKLWSP